MAKIFNVTVGLIFIAIGILGVCFPEILANFYGFTLQSIQAKTELRAVTGLSLSVGYLLVHFAFVLKKQTIVLLSVMLLTLSYIVPRILGLIVDGWDQPMMHYELIFELVVLAIAFALYKQEAAKENQ